MLKYQRFNDSQNEEIIPKLYKYQQFNKCHHEKK